MRSSDINVAMELIPNKYMIYYKFTIGQIQILRFNKNKIKAEPNRGAGNRVEIVFSFISVKMENPRITSIDMIGTM